MQTKPLDELASLYQRAHAFAVAIESVQLAKANLEQSYTDWKQTNGVEHFIFKGDDEWQAMMRDTSPQYMALRAAKARKSRAEKRLMEAVKEVQGWS